MRRRVCAISAATARLCTVHCPNAVPALMSGGHADGSGGGEHQSFDAGGLGCRNWHLGFIRLMAPGRKVFQVVTALLAFAQIRWSSVYLWLRVASVFWCSMAFWLYSTARHVRIASVSSKSYWLVGGRACGRIRFVGSSGFMAPGRISAMGVNLGMACASAFWVSIWGWLSHTDFGFQVWCGCRIS